MPLRCRYLQRWQVGQKVLVRPSMVDDLSLVLPFMTLAQARRENRIVSNSFDRETQRVTFKLRVPVKGRGEMEIEYVLERAQLKSLFSVVISADGVNNHKPDPECFQLAFDRVNEILRQQRQLPFLPHECLVIEDSAQGVQAGRALGMRTLGVTNTISEAALRAAGAEVVTPSLADWTVDAVELVYR